MTDGLDSTFRSSSELSWCNATSEHVPLILLIACLYCFALFLNLVIACYILAFSCSHISCLIFTSSSIAFILLIVLILDWRLDSACFFLSLSSSFSFLVFASSSHRVLLDWIVFLRSFFIWFIWDCDLCLHWSSSISFSSICRWRVSYWTLSSSMVIYFHSSVEVRSSFHMDLTSL